jgi:regulation of enolase protein 1 (concanavalin A-like superfamily)
MMIPTNTLRVLSFIAVAAIAVFLACTGDKDLAGTGNSTGNARALGKVLAKDGTPSPNTLVRLVPVDYNPVEPSVPALASDTTASDGRYELLGWIGYRYNIEGVSFQSGERVLVQDITAGDGGTIEVADAILRTPGALVIPLPVENIKPGDYLYISGTSTAARIDSNAVARGYVVLDSIASDSVRSVNLVVAMGDLLPAEPLIPTGVGVPEGDTALVPSLLPSPWVSIGIGETGLKGSSAYSAGAFIVNGSGVDIWDTADGFHFVYQEISGNFDLSARVVRHEDDTLFVKAGIMVREQLTPQSRTVALCLELSTDGTPQKISTMLSRSAEGDSIIVVADTREATPPYWVRLTRSDSMFTAYGSTDGINWAAQATDTVALGSTVYAGLCVSSHNVQKLNTAVFDNVQLQ